MKFFLTVALIFSFCSRGHLKALHHPDEEKSTEIKTDTLPVITAANMDVRLEGGLLQLLVGRRGAVPLCFPHEASAVARLFRLAHAACRQLGQAAIRLQERRLAVDEGLSGGRCEGHERDVAQCDWSTMKLQPCQQVAEVHCGNCGETFTDTEGLIRTPGYPVTFLYHLSCEWRIEVPHSSAIHLVFDSLNTPPLEQSAFECANDKPYVELTYGAQGHYSIYRYCNFKDLKNLSVPSNSLKIYYSSGVYDPSIIHIQDEPQGLAISFRAEPVSTDSPLWWVVVLTVGLIVFIAGAVLCYYCRRTLRRELSQSHPRAPNVPGISDLERAYDFQRCHIQAHSKPGLRLRSTGSGKSKLSSIIHPVKENIRSTFRKLSSSQMSTPPNPHFHSDPEMLLHCKASLVDRYSPRHPSETSVFVEQPPFTIYCSESDTAVDIPRETAL